MSTPMSYSTRLALTRWLGRSRMDHGLRFGPVSRQNGAAVAAARGFSSYPPKDPIDPHVLGQEILQRSEYLARLTGLPPNKFKEVVKASDPIRRASESQLEAVFRCLQEKDIGSEEIMEEPRVLIMHPLLIDNYYQCLKELGHSCPPLKLIKSYPYAARGRISKLRAEGVIKSGDLINSLLKIFEDDNLPRLEDEVRRSVPPDYVREWSLQHLWTRIQAVFLVEKWGINLNASVHLLSTIPRARNKSLTHFKENCRILTELFGLPKTKLLSNAYALTGHPSNMMKIWNDVPSIAGISTRDVVVKLPKLLLCPASNLTEIDEILMKDYKFPPETVQRMLDVYTLSPETVKERLAEIDQVPHFKALKFHPRVLRLVVYQQKAKMRLEQLEALNLKILASVDMLSAPSYKFDKILDVGYGRTRGRDLVLLLAAALHVDADIIKEELHKHPYWCHVPIVDVKATLTLLLVRGYTEEQILNALQLLLYPEDLVIKFLESVPCKPELQPFDETWKDHQRILHLILYYIERESNFAGTSVFREQSGDEMAKKLPQLNPKHPYFIARDAEEAVQK